MTDRLASGAEARSGTIVVQLEARAPFDADALIGFLAARAVPDVESVEGSTYRRSLALPRGAATLELTPAPDLEGPCVRCRLQGADPADVDAAVASCRRLLDLDADPAAIGRHLGPDPVLGPLVRRRPGLRVPGATDGFELAVRAIVGQQVSVAGARTILGRLAARYGEEHEDGALTHRFPSATSLAGSDPGAFPFPRSRGEALVALARAAAAGEIDLDPGADPERAHAELLAIRGIGPWTAGYVAMRACGDADAWLPGDVGVRNALDRLGQPSGESAARRLAERWRPWRSYAIAHLWASL